MAQYWPTHTAIENDHDVASRMNSKPKIVVSGTLERPDPEWSNTTLVKHNVAGEMRRLKDQPGQDLLVLGARR